MSQATAYRVSEELLERADFKAACAARDFGELFKLMRKWDGASQDRISSPVDGLTQSRVSKIIRGEDRVASLDLVERIVDGLRIPGSYFGLLPRSWELVDVVDADPTTVAPPTPPSALEAGAITQVNGSQVNGVTRPLPSAMPGQVFAPTRVERPAGLRPHIERAFESTDVSIDFAGFSGETLAVALGEPLDKVRSGHLKPSSVRIRILVPDTDRPWALPCRMEDRADEPAFRQRMAGIAERSLSSMVEALAELQYLGLVPEVSTEIRVHGLAPLFKLYVINGREAFFGFYTVVEHMVKYRGQVTAMYDAMGRDSLLFHHTDDGDETSAATQYVLQARAWFDSVWSTVATDYERD
jgi:hypothetical protein